MSTLVLKNGRVLDPSQRIDKKADVRIDVNKGTVEKIGGDLKGDRTLDCTD